MSLVSQSFSNESIRLSFVGIRKEMLEEFETLSEYTRSLLLGIIANENDFMNKATCFLYAPPFFLMADVFVANIQRVETLLES